VPKARRGEFWIADLGLVAKVRPVLILSVDYQGMERAVVTYVLHTTSLRGTQYEVPHSMRGMPPGAIDAQGIDSVVLT
jgi:mRNA interferase MazF